MLLASGITASFVVAGLSAWRLLKAPQDPAAGKTLRFGAHIAAVLVPIQVVVGDLHGLNTLEHQPAKIAAMEGLWETGSRVPANLFAIPDQDAEMNHFEIAIPVLGSIYLTHDPNGTVQGLKAFPREDRPPVAVVFFAFRIMVGIALLMFALVLSGIVLFARGRLEQSRTWLRCATLGMPLGFIAVIAGWTTTEAGLLRTKDSVTPSLTAANVGLSWLLYVLAYLVIFGAGFTLLRRLVRVGPSEATQGHEGDQLEPEKRAARPLSALSNKTVAAAGAKSNEPPPRA
jgi:cytochrome d ubiquinol oxidase subunit I